MKTKWRATVCMLWLIGFLMPYSPVLADDGCTVVWHLSKVVRQDTYEVSIGISFKVIGLGASLSWKVLTKEVAMRANCVCKPCCSGEDHAMHIRGNCSGVSRAYEDLQNRGTASWNWPVNHESAGVIEDTAVGECTWKQSVLIGREESTETWHEGRFYWTAPIDIGLSHRFTGQTLDISCSGQCACEPFDVKVEHPPLYLSAEWPAVMNLGETAEFETIWVDEGNDLLSVRYSAGNGLSSEVIASVNYLTSGYANTYRAVSRVRAESPHGIEGANPDIVFVATDSQTGTGFSEPIACYVNQAPDLQLEEAGWEDGRYAVRFSIDDPDFATRPDRYRERVALSIGAPQCDEPDWGVVGGDGWTSSFTSATEGIELYIEPLGDGACRAECSLEVRATDANGFTDTLLISVPSALCAIDSSVSAKLGAVVELPMGCTNPEAYPDDVVAYELGEVDLDGVGTISGTPPDCTLSILATNCHDEVEIPYTIR